MNHATENTLEAALARLLTETRHIVKGDKDAVDRLMDMMAQPDLPEAVRELADCFGHLSVSIEAREYRLELVLEDLLEKQAALEEAMHDALTGLPNRAIFHQSLETACQQAKAQQQTLAVVFVDLDKFKPINDTLGHDAGDELLQMVALRLQGAIRNNDLAARLGGDEFALILGTLPDKAEALRISQRVLQELATPFALAAAEVKIGGSLGVSFYPHDGDTPTTLLKSADMAMYRAKSEGRNAIRCYNPKDEALA